ncbi:NAD(P)-binding domain protein [Niveomyces insectorum RCEF 264]|uniref:NAD(P)-binding domain protein n=1 Tax=Niveomyces insectorum RCEF 264 TaxID=1081102 RepID=A0A167SLX5_9HYPO|nr:NAD(P)-binding domain protein [Niveomyces insectorum RCEF 264]
MASLKDKVIAVTGAGSGIGKATALECGARGASLALSDINEAAVQSVVAELTAKGIPAIGSKVDVSNSDSVDAWIAGAVAHYGRLDGAANVAGIVGSLKGNVFTNITDISNEHWNDIIGINLTGLFYCLRAELRVMKAGASVLNVASMAGLMGRPGIAAYSTSKHGVVGLTRSAAKEVGERGIRVNALAPGPVDTPMMATLKAGAGGEERPVTETYKHVPLRRLGTSDDMARTIAFALSDDASYTNGAIFSVDGGIAC